jgi:uncharacterized protein (TIGR00369 family)
MELRDMIDLAEQLNGDQTPIALLLGRTIIAADHEGHVRLRFEARPEFCNGDGVVQGGLVAAMLDAALGAAVRAKAGADARPVTTEFSVRFVRPVCPGAVDVVGRVLAYAGRTAIVQAEVIDAEGQIIACATSTKLVKLK